MGVWTSQSANEWAVFEQQYLSSAMLVCFYAWHCRNGPVTGLEIVTLTLILGGGLSAQPVSVGHTQQMPNFSEPHTWSLPREIWKLDKFQPRITVALKIWSCRRSIEKGKNQEESETQQASVGTQVPASKYRFNCQENSNKY